MWGPIVESAATINARDLGSEKSREFSQDSATTPGEFDYCDQMVAACAGFTSRESK